MPHSKGFGSGKRERTSEAVPIADILREVMQRREFRAGAEMAAIMEGWEEIVGPRLAEETVPISLQRGVLTVGASTGPWAAQVSFLEADIRRNANARLTSDAVKQVRVTIRKPL